MIISKSTGRLAYRKDMTNLTDEEDVCWFKSLYELVRVVELSAAEGRLAEGFGMGNRTHLMGSSAMYRLTGSRKSFRMKLIPTMRSRTTRKNKKRGTKGGLGKEEYEGKAAGGCLYKLDASSNILNTRISL